MTQKAFLRKPFDRSRELVVSRQFLFNGALLAPGQVFDKTLTTPRRLRLLYDQRYLRHAEAADLPKQEETASARRRLVKA